MEYAVCGGAIYNICLICIYYIGLNESNYTHSRMVHFCLFIVMESQCEVFFVLIRYYI